jgi:predicted nucleic acid-binding protein
LDLAIAATALEHGLTVVTRNVSDFANTGVALLDPFDPRTGRRRT